MFSWDSDCASCSYFEPGMEKDGKFKCTKNDCWVSANKGVCGDAREAFGRGTYDKESYRRTSKDHGYYVVTALYQILGIKDPELMDTFMYVRDVVMENDSKYSSLIGYYENVGPMIKDAMLNQYAENKKETFEYAEFIYDLYMREFIFDVKSNNVDKAINDYFKLIEELSTKYNSSVEKNETRI